MQPIVPTPDDNDVVFRFLCQVSRQQRESLHPGCLCPQPEAATLSALRASDLWYPGAPDTEPPGNAPDPHRYRFFTGVSRSSPRRDVKRNSGPGTGPRGASSIRSGLVFEVLGSEKHLVYYYLVQVGHVCPQMVQAPSSSCLLDSIPAAFCQFVWDMK